MVEVQQHAASRRQDAVLIISDDADAQIRVSRALGDETAIVTAQAQGISNTLHQLLTTVAVIAECNAVTLAVLKDILSYSPRTKVIVVVDSENNGDAVLALEAGATDIIERPYSDDLLRMMVKRAQYIASLESEVERLRTYERQQHAILGGSAPMVQLLRMVDRVASTDVNTLVYGESGTGKALMARAIHDRSTRSNKPFITLNCASLPEDMLDAELFGIERGNFDSRQIKIGKIEAAHGGTLFLDEIGDMPLSIQAKVLRFFQERVVDRIAGERSIPVDVKVVAATYHDLGARVSEKKFRDDLLHHVGEVTINIPPLRDRGDDVLLLAKTFLLQFNQTMNRKINGFSDDAVNALMTYAWPGNVRELQNKVKSAVIMADGTQISAADLALTKEHQKDSGLPLNLRQVREEAERNAVTRALARAEGNMSQSANLLGISRPTLYTLIEKYSLQR